MARPSDLSRATAERHCVGPVRRSRWKPYGWAFERGSERMFVKDVRRTSWLFRYTLGRLAIAHETRIYRRLRGLEFVPDCVGRFDADSLVLGEIRGTSIRRFGIQYLRPEFFDELERCIDALHARGVVHLDLRHAKNILAGEDGRPRLIDFETALYVGRRLRPLLAWIDRSAVLKFRLRYRPHEVTSRQARRYAWFRGLRTLWPFGRLWPPPWCRRRRPATRARA